VAAGVIQSQKWAYLAALHAHRAAMILADRAEAKTAKIVKAITEVGDWNAAESVLRAAYNAAADDGWSEDD